MDCFFSIILFFLFQKFDVLTSLWFIWMILSGQTMTYLRSILVVGRIMVVMNYWMLSHLFLIIYQMVSYGMRQWILIKQIFLYVPPQKSEILTLPYIYLNDFFGQTMADSNLKFVFWLNSIDISGINQCFAYHFHFSWIRKCSNLFDSLSICSIS